MGAIEAARGKYSPNYPSRAKNPRMPKVSHEILSWARETAGLSPSEAVEKLGIGDARGVSAVDRLATLEAGEVEPSRPLLLKMAQHYRRPLVTFYMSAPPRKGSPHRRGGTCRRAGPRYPRATKYGSRCACRRRRGQAATVHRIDEYGRWCRRGAHFYPTNSTNRLV